MDLAAKATEVGGISKVFETESAYHIMKLERRVDERVAPLSDVRDRIIVELQRLRMTEASKRYVDNLFQLPDLKIDLKSLAASPSDSDTVVVTLGGKE